MTLAPGLRLGSYEILSPLGAGGMGEVYRARDSRLGREVAIKVLPAEVAADPERLARFEREAKAVSALNHPHIVTLYELGSSDFGPYLALEKIDGRSLRELLREGTLPVKRALALGAQIAEGLAKAHAAGIVHRDLKPENVMVTEDGFAKILDFGLAKLVAPELEAGSTAEATTLGGATAPGLVLGTPGYLSPEQAAGHATDFRTDQFALGALLYEMVTGQRPFRGATTGESLAAVLRDEPVPLRSRNPAIPLPVGWIVERCLAKDPGERYASTRDLARDLADLRDHLSEISRAGEAFSGGAGRPAVRLRPAGLLAGVAIVAALAAGTLAIALLGRDGGAAPPSYRPLTLRRGVITGARFAPDGATVYYSAAFGAEPSHLYVTRLEGSESQRLELPPAMLLSVSRNGELLVLLTGERNPGNAVGTLARVSALGGTPRPLIDDAMDADWLPDGEQLAVVRAGLRLELPLGEERFRGVRHFRLSPDGSRVAFFNMGRLAIEVHDLHGGQLLRHEMPLVWGLAWSPDGREVWFTGSQNPGGTDRALYAVSLAGEERLVARAPGALNLLDVAPDGRSALVSTGSGWIGIGLGRRGAPDEERTFDLLGRSFLAGLSADGTRMLVDERQEPGRGAYLVSTEDGTTIRLGAERPLALSPDGAWALVFEPEEPTRMKLLPTGAGIATELRPESALRPMEGMSAAWSRDGERLFALLHPQGESSARSRVYVRDGKAPWRPITPEIVWAFVPSPDGRQVAIGDPAGGVSVVAVDGGAARSLAGESGLPLGWSADGRWLLVQAPGSLPARIHRRELASGRIEPWGEILPADPTGAVSIMDVLLAADGETYAYNVMRASQQLFLAEGLR
ncbi:MAG TPA: protein kinase [Thermoanaerobaculia bacterium]|nr:protein kinase [Thermoanaerobaculia bacterium]